MLESIGDRVKKAITDSGLTQSAVADHCDVSKQAVSGWIKTNTIDKQNLSKLCELTGADYDWVLTGKARQPEPTHGIKEGKGMYTVTPDNIEFLSKLEQLDDTSRQQLSIFMEGLLVGQGNRAALNAKTPHSLPEKNKAKPQPRHEEK